MSDRQVLCDSALQILQTDVRILKFCQEVKCRQAVKWNLLVSNNIGFAETEVTQQEVSCSLYKRQILPGKLVKPGVNRAFDKVGSHRPVLIFKSGFCQTILLPKQFVTDNFCFLFTNWLPPGKNVVCHWK